MKWPKVFAHRGGRKWAPENTLIAFEKSLELGCDGIELDVQRCASGELVVIHDEDLSRTTNGIGLIKDATLPELKRLSAGAWYDKEFSTERIPTLEEVLTLVSGKLIVNIEIKNAPVSYDGIEHDLIALLEGYAHKDRLIISSFDHQFMLRLHKLQTGLKLAVLADGILIDLKEYAEKLGAKCWHPCWGSLTEAAIEDAHAANLEVNAWTINEQRDWVNAAKFNLDAIITDDPVGLKALIDRALQVDVIKF
jgi:glycerophosphoryl diester phosphodiesterase